MRNASKRIGNTVSQTPDTPRRHRRTLGVAAALAAVLGLSAAVDALNGFLHANAAGLHSALGQDSGASIASILARHALVGSDFDS